MIPSRRRPRPLQRVKIEARLLADEGVDVRRTLTDEAALTGVMEGALEYPTEAVEEVAASGLPDKSEAVELLTAGLMRLPEGP